jgi:hypothetical protein
MAAFCCDEVSMESSAETGAPVRAVDAEFIGLLTLIDRFQPPPLIDLSGARGFHTLLTRDSLPFGESV